MIVFLKMLLLLVADACLVNLTQSASQNYGVPLLDGRIVGGKPAFIENYPYQASLLYFTSHICGAVIISDYYVVTAAHCTARYAHSVMSSDFG